MIHSIMVPLDCSSFGERALPYARSIARRAGARVEVAHKHVPPAPVLPDGVLAEEKKVGPETRARERAYLDGVVGRLTEAGVPAGAVLLEGGTVEALCRHAAASAADLVVMTTHGRGPLTRFWLGSVADGLLRGLTTPLLLVRPREEDEGGSEPEPAFRRILIPLDGSPEAEAVLGPAVALGTTMGADYTLLRVIDPLTSAGWDMPGYITAEAALLEGLQQETDCYLEGTARRLRERGLTVQTESIVHPSAAGAILELARNGRYDLVALATHGRGAFARLVLGSVADKVVRGLAAPVLVYRAPAGKT